jgi:3-dehydrosphinganine reductase
MKGHAIITGGSSGIGLALARRLAGQGYALTLIARDAVRLQEVAGSLSQTDAMVQTHALDVCDRIALSQAVTRAVARMGPPRLLVVSAGIAVAGYFEALDDSAFEVAMTVNYFGSLNAIRAVLPHMKAAEGSKTIVLISSAAGLVGIFGYAAYAPSKFAVRGLAEVLRAELAPLGIRICIAYPPDTDTPQLTEENLAKPVETRAITAKGGIWSADDVAKAILEGVRKRRFVIAPGLTMKLLAAFHSPLGPFLRRSFDRARDEARRAKGGLFDGRKDG